MQMYTNKFSLALNDDKTEVMVNFYQNVPVVPEQSENKPTVSTNIPSEIIPVANLAMTGQLARNFARVLLDLLDKDAIAE